jgi:polyhydroxyalkanoate synthesis regulator phasin
MKDAVLFGIGLVSLSKEKAEEAVKKLSASWNASEKEGREMVDQFLKESAEAKDRLEDQIKKTVTETLAKIPVVSRGDFDKLSARLDAIEKELLEGKNG